MNDELKLDVHTHTVMSGHAYSTLQEMVTAAQEKHLQILGITEHAPGIPGTCHPIYFRNLHVVPRQWGELRLMLGAELNILDTQGTLDLDATPGRKSSRIRATARRNCSSSPSCWLQRRRGRCSKSTTAASTLCVRRKRP